MKGFIIASIIATFVIIIITTGYVESIRQKDLIIDSLKVELNKSLAIDTAYYEHFKECSLIWKDQLYIDNGFLKVKKVRYLSEQ